MAYLHDDDWKPVTRSDATGKIRLPVRRPPGAPTPCVTCPKIPPGAPAPLRQYAVEMSDQGWQTYRHYLECKAVGRFPEDALVERHAGLIRRTEDVHADLKPFLMVAFQAMFSRPKRG